MLLCLGSTVLSLPWCTAGCGVLNGMLWTVLVLYWNYWTLLILAKAADATGVFKLEGLLARCSVVAQLGRQALVTSCTVAISTSRPTRGSSSSSSFGHTSAENYSSLGCNSHWRSAISASRASHFDV